MSEKYGNFQSQTAIKAKSEEKQRARELILEKAKRKYEVEEARREKARKAGEGTWMLDSLSKRLDNEEKALEKAKKKRKKEKKEKKKKKKKKKSKDTSSSSSSEDEEPKWVEQDVAKPTRGPQQGPQLQRESWMEAPMDLIPLTSRQEIRERINRDKAEAKREADKLLAPGQHARELNPHWKEGGTGLPEEKPAVTTDTSLGSGDGGLSWLRTALSRCKQQAQDQGRSLEEVAAERWGSLQNLMDKLREAERQQGKGRQSDRGALDRPGFYRRDDRDRQRLGERSEGSRHRQRRGSSSDEDRRRHRRRRDSSSSEDRDSESEKRRGRHEREEDSRRRGDKDEDRDGRRRDKYGRDEDRSGRNKGRHDRDHKGSEGSRPRLGFQRPGSDDDEDDYKTSSRSKSKGFMRPKDNDDSADSRSRRFQRPSDSEGADTERRNVESQRRRFAKPGEDDGGSRPSRLSSPGERDVPRWKKKLPVAEDRSEGGREREAERKRSKKEKSRTPSSSESSSSESENGPSDAESTPAPPVAILSEEELNDLAAKILRAELMGEEDLAAQLKQKLETARKHREDSKSGTNAAPDFSARRQAEGQRSEGRKRKNGRGEEEEEDDVVVLSRTTKAGLVRPVLGEATDAWGGGASKKKKKKNIATHDKEGMRTSYFDNDDRFDLKTLVEQEKAGTAEDQNAMFSRLAGRSGDRDLDVDDMFVSRAAKKQNDEQTFDKDRAGAIFEHRKRTSAMEKCQRCLKQVPKHLIIALGTKSYLCLPPHRSLTEGHCLVVPMSHSASVTALDEDVWQEMQHFRQSLVQMFEAQELDVVVMETVMHLKHFPHTVLECVPLDREMGDLAPIYFKKAIQDAGPEWSDNKKLHDLKGKDVRRVIPKGFPYFAVDFGLQSGYATVIEDESTFPAYFGREIVGGMIDAEPFLWRKPHKQSFEDQRKKVLDFEKWWRPFDWTQDMDATS